MHTPRTQAFRFLLPLMTTILLVTTVSSASTLTVWQGNVGPNEEARALYSDVLIPEFEESHPGVKVEVNFFDWKTFDDQLALAYATGKGPDIVNQNNLPKFVEQDLIIPLDRYLAEWPEWEDFLPGLDDMITWKGKTYGIPQLLAPRVFLYNKQHFSQAGLDPNRPPEDWATLRDFALKLTKRDGGTITQVGSLRQQRAAGGFDAYLWANGGEMLDQDSQKPLFASPEGVEALRFWSELAQEVNPAGTSASLASFINGKASMVPVVNQQQAMNFRDANGEDPGMAVLPPAEKGGRSYVLLYGGPLAIGSQSKNPGLAWEFMKLLMTFDNQMAFNQALSFIPPRRSALQQGYVLNDSILMGYLQLAALNGRANWLFRGPEQKTLSAMLEQEINQTYNGGQPARTALEKAAEAWQSFLDEFWSK